MSAKRLHEDDGADAAPRIAPALRESLKTPEDDSSDAPRPWSHIDSDAVYPTAHAASLALAKLLLATDAATPPDRYHLPSRFTRGTPLSLGKIPVGLAASLNLFKNELGTIFDNPLERAYSASMYSGTERSAHKCPLCTVRWVFQHNSRAVAAGQLCTLCHSCCWCLPDFYSASMWAADNHMSLDGALALSSASRRRGRNATDADSCGGRGYHYDGGGGFGGGGDEGDDSISVSVPIGSPAERLQQLTETYQALLAPAGAPCRVSAVGSPLPHAGVYAFPSIVTNDDGSLSLSTSGARPRVSLLTAVPVCYDGGMTHVFACDICCRGLATRVSIIAGAPLSQTTPVAAVAEVARLCGFPDQPCLHERAFLGAISIPVDDHLIVASTAGLGGSGGGAGGGAGGGVGGSAGSGAVARLKVPPNASEACQLGDGSVYYVARIIPASINGGGLWVVAPDADDASCIADLTTSCSVVAQHGSISAAVAGVAGGRRSLPLRCQRCPSRDARTDNCRHIRCVRALEVALLYDPGAEPPPLELDAVDEEGDSVEDAALPSQFLFPLLETSIPPLTSSRPFYAHSEIHTPAQIEPTEKVRVRAQPCV